MTRYRYIHFMPLGARRWSCHNTKTGAVLGEVSYYPHWRQLCFVPGEGLMFSAGCLADIQDFIEQQKARQP